MKARLSNTGKTIGIYLPSELKGKRFEVELSKERKLILTEGLTGRTCHGDCSVINTEPDKYMNWPRHGLIDVEFHVSHIEPLQLVTTIPSDDQLPLPRRLKKVRKRAEEKAPTTPEPTPEPNPEPFSPEPEIAAERTYNVTLEVDGRTMRFDVPHAALVGVALGWCVDGYNVPQA